MDTIEGGQRGALPRLTALDRVQAALEKTVPCLEPNGRFGLSHAQEQHKAPGLKGFERALVIVANPTSALPPSDPISAFAAEVERVSRTTLGTFEDEVGISTWKAGLADALLRG